MSEPAPDQDFQPFSVYARTAKAPREPVTWPYLAGGCLILVVIGFLATPKGGLIYNPGDTASPIFAQFMGMMVGRTFLLVFGAALGAGIIWTLLWFTVLQFRRRVAAPYFLAFIAAGFFGLMVPQVGQYITAIKGIPAPRQAADWERGQTAGLAEDMRIAWDEVTNNVGPQITRGGVLKNDRGLVNTRARVAAARAAVNTLAQKLRTRDAQMQATVNAKTRPDLKAAFQTALRRYREGSATQAQRYVDLQLKALDAMGKAFDVIARGRWVAQGDMVMFNNEPDLIATRAQLSIYDANMNTALNLKWAIQRRIQQINDRTNANANGNSPPEWATP